MDEKFLKFRDWGPSNFSLKNPVCSAWSTDHVIETYPGVDGVVRLVKVKTPNNKLVRPTASLCLLEAVL